MCKHFPFVLLVAGALLLSIVPRVYAEAPLAQTQVPGYYRMPLGRFEVTVLYDGAIELDTRLLQHTKATDLDRLLARMFVGNPKMQTAVNGYLINTGTHLVQIDAGATKLFGPPLGFLLENMRAAGYDPAQVDTVIITHLHPDHIGGLNDASGQPLFLFPKATV